MQTGKRSNLLRRVTVVLVGFILLWSQLVMGLHGIAQKRRPERSAPDERREPREEGNIVERAITTICTERAQDPLGSIPIDEMGAQQPLPLTDARVKEGRKRAERLLPSAKKLVPSLLSQLAATYNLEALSRDWIKERVNAVRVIKAEVENHDNASWRPNEPHAIIFGTVFLAGLRSDEAMIAVLAHELTHAIDGTDQALLPLVRRIRARASQVGGASVGEDMAIELTCEMVGLRVMRDYTSRTGNAKTMAQRLTRAMGKDCVHLDLADESHLSPRETMRLLLKLEPDLATAIIKAKEDDFQRMKKDRSTSHNLPVRF